MQFHYTFNCSIVSPPILLTTLKLSTVWSPHGYLAKISTFCVSPFFISVKIYLPGEDENYETFLLQNKNKSRKYFSPPHSALILPLMKKLCYIFRR